MNRSGVAYKAKAGPGELLGATLDGVGASGAGVVGGVQVRSGASAGPAATQLRLHRKDGGSFDGRFGGRRVRFLQPLADGSPGVVVHEAA